MSTVSGLQTPGFCTKEFTSTPGNVGAVGSMIDYFLIGKKARKQVANVKVVRGAEIRVLITLYI